MTKAVILLAPSNLFRELCFMRADGAQQAFIKSHIDEYVRCPEIETDKTGEDAAEEMFDLTNNPFRQDEREQKYGRGRSLSVGDVVEVDGVKWACNSVGWEVMETN